MGRLRWECGLLSPTILERQAVVTCRTVDDLDDPRFGPGGALDTTCATCRHPAITCPGHWGCIVLAEPVYHVLFVAALARTLNGTCHQCARANVRRKTPCPHCGTTAPVPPRYRVDGDRLVQGGTGVVPRTLVPLLRRLDDDTCIALGWLRPARAHPLWALVTVLPVAPPAVRPAVQGRPHGLTSKYRSVLRLNAVLRDALATAPPHIRRDFHQQLQWTVTTLFDAYETAGGAARAAHDRAMAAADGRGGGSTTFQARQGSLKQRFGGKEGRLRAHLMGKRVDFCARTVISPDPHLALDEVGVPAAVAARLTVPFHVTVHNLMEARTRLRRGWNHPQGARTYTDKDGRRYDLKVFRVEHVRVGDTLERPLQTGDRVLMNRQPTLHRGSMMAHTVRVLPGATFRLNLAVTTPYNADFDGDEMNMHVPQTWAARTEAETLLGVAHHVISPQTCAPAMGLVQDALVAAYLCTRGDTWLDVRDTQALLFASNPNVIPRMPVPAIMAPVPLWSGLQLVTAVLQSTVPSTHWSTLTLFDAPDGVVVRNGVVACGPLDKRTLGPGRPNQLLQCLARTTGHVPGVAPVGPFLDRMSALGHAFLALRGMSTGVGDCVLPSARVQTDIDALLHPPSGPIPVAGLNAVRDDVGRLVHAAVGRDNHMKAMADSGSKGSRLNMAQIAGCVGQQHLTGPGGRAPVRALPHFHRGDHGAAAGGFVAQSYLQGLDPHGFWFHAQAGRDGIIDTACKTATTGYLERKLVKALESVVVAYDGTVRHLAWDHAVVQFVYGDDGFDATRLVRCGTDPPRPYDVRALFHQCRTWTDGSGSWSVTPSAVARTRALDTATQALVQPEHQHHVRTTLQTAFDAALPWLTDTALTYIAGELHRRTVEARVAPGEAVGAVAATCLAEPATQLTLNTFHFTGISSKTGNLGVPRLLELLAASKRPRAAHVTVPLDDPDVVWPVPSRTLASAATTYAYTYGVPPSVTSSWWSTYAYTYGPCPDAMRWFVHWHVPRGHVHPAACRRVVHDARHTVYMAVSPTGHDVVAAVDPLTNPRRVLDAVRRAVGEAVPVTDGPYGPWTWALHGCVDDVDRHARTVTYTGGPSTLRTLLGEWCATVVPNDPVATCHVLGIEAARTVLCREITAVLAFNGSYVAPRHVALLADVMTWHGDVCPVNRHGFHRYDPVVKQMTFESTIPAVVEAAMTGADDALAGVSEHVLTGQAVPVGTGLAGACLLDVNALERYGSTVRATGVTSVMVRSPRPMKRGRVFVDAGTVATTGTVNPWAPTAMGDGDATEEEPVDADADADADDDLVLDDDPSDDDDNEACFSPLVDVEEEEGSDGEGNANDGTHLETKKTLTVVAPPYRESHVEMDTATTTVTTVTAQDANDTPFVFCLGPAV